MDPPHDPNPARYLMTSGGDRAAPLVGARLAAFWLYVGKTDEEVLAGLIAELRISREVAEDALHQAHRWRSERRK